MKIAVIIAVVILILAFLLGGAYFGRRNQMVVKREAVSASWAQVDVVLQRRADLIPNLVETVKCLARRKSFWRYRRGAFRFDRRENTCR